MAQVIADRVKETSTTTGTGAFTLAGAMTGFKAFSDVCANTDTVYYTIQGVDGSGNPTAEWEVGLGSWATGGTLTRTTVLSSSNSGSAVSFSSGTKHVWLDLPATQIKTFAAPITTDVSATGWGETLTLPDATTLFVGQQFCYKNNSPYDKAVKNSAGTLLGFLKSYSDVYLTCSNISTSVGEWNLSNVNLSGVLFERFSEVSLGSTPSLTITDVDSSRQFFLLVGGSNIYGVIYDKSTNTWGSNTLIRASGSVARAIKSDTDQILVVSASTTAMEAVVLTLSGTAISVNTAGTATLASAINAIDDLIQVGTSSSFACMFSRSAALGVRAISISGTAATIGSEGTTTGTATNRNLFSNSNTVFTYITTSSTTIYIKAFSVSGSTLTAGTEINTAGTSVNRTMQLSSGRIVMSWTGSPNIGLISVSGTVPSLSSVAIASSATSVSDWIEISSTKLLFIVGGTTKLYVNHLLDNGSGVASVGTAKEILGGLNSGIILAKIGTDVHAACQASTTLQNLGIIIDSSGNSPVLTSIKSIPLQGGTVPNAPQNGTTKRSSSVVETSGGYLCLSQISSVGSYFYKNGIPSLLKDSTVIRHSSLDFSTVPTERWSYRAAEGFYSISLISTAP